MIKSDRWNQIQQLYEAALKRQASERGGFLREACGEDESLRREVEQLLAHEETAKEFLEVPAVEVAARSLGEDQNPSLLGQQIDAYQILSLLGAGGMGVVYQARDTRLGRDVAIKVLPRHFANDPERMARFEREAKLLASLNHPNIATIYSLEQTQEGRFIVMELVEGQNLSSKIGGRPVDLCKLLEIGIQVAEALIEAHGKGIVHRDIKSANLMITPRDQVKILDFGLAKLDRHETVKTDETTMTGTEPGLVMGTRNYMSPEQALGQTVDHRTDIYSLGVVLCEMATGNLPESDKRPMEITARITDAQASVTDCFNKAVVTELGRIVQKCLTMDQRQRYQSAQDLLTDLKELKRARVTGATLTVAQAKHHIVGRQKEIAALQTGLQQVFAGPSLLLCVAGEPGIGKTTVVEQFLHEVAIGSRPCLIAKGQCSERLAGTEAYLPFLEALESLLQKEVDVSVAGLMREKAPWWYVQVASLSPDDSANAGILADVKHVSQERVKRELRAFLRDVSSKRPLVLFFEDLHWADVSSIDMLAYLAAKFDAMRLLIVATYRPTELQLTGHPFLQIKPNLLSRGQCREIALGFLPQQAIKHYLELEFPEHAFPATFAKLIHDKTEGSPLFMVDLLRDLQGRDVIVEEEGRWQLAQSVEGIRLELPDSVKGMIEHKIQQLGENERRLLVAASVQGFQFDSAVVSRVLETNEEEVEERLQALESDHRILQLVEEAEFPDSTLTLRYRFVHVLYQNELYSSLTGTKRVRLSRKAAETLEGFYGDKSGKVAAELASLYETARDYEKAIYYLNEAAAQAAGVFGYQEAITLAQRGLELVETLPESADRDLQELSLQATLGASIVAIKGYGDVGVGKAFTRARELSDKLGTDRLSNNVAYGLILYFNVTVQLHKTLELCHELLEQNRQRNDYARPILSHNGKGIAEQFLGNFASASTHLERAIQLNEAQGQHSVGSPVAWDCVVYGLGHLAWNVWILGFPDKALGPSAEARVKAEESHNPFNMVHYYAFAGFLYQCRGDAKKVIDLSDVKYAVSEENGYQLNMAWANMQKGWAIADQGNPEKGLQMLLEGLAIWRAVGVVVMVPYYHALIAEIYGKVNQSKEGLAILEESFDIVNKTDHRMWEAELHRIKGQLLHQQGAAESRVEACYKKALEIARTQEAKSFELRAAMSLSRLWQLQSKHKQATKLLNEIYGWFTEGFETRDLCEANQLLRGLQ